MIAMNILQKGRHASSLLQIAAVTLLLLISHSRPADAWVSHSPMTTTRTTRIRPKLTSQWQAIQPPLSARNGLFQRSLTRSSGAPFHRELVIRHMYNLPPGRNNNDLGEILKGVAGVALVVLFFASPLGAFVLSIFNSLLLLSILLPTLATIGYRAWRYFNILEGACPNCGAPASVLKSKEGDADKISLCFNCGAALQANYENDKIVDVTRRSRIDTDDVTVIGGPFSIFDEFFGSGFPSGTTITEETVVIDDRKKTPSGRKSRPKKGDIIDVEVERDDDTPWQ